MEPQKNITLNLNNQLIAQHNDLIKSIADMRKTSMKIFELAVGALDATNQKQHRKVTIKKSIIFDILNQKGNSRNSHLRDALKDLQHNALFHLMPSESSSHEVLISPISKIEWSEDEDYISLFFSPDILPYITLLKENFTQYKLEYIAKMESKYSIVLYKIFSMYYNQYDYYKNRGIRRNDQINQYCNPKLTIQELRKQTGTINKYKNRFSDFKNKVLDKAVNEISQKTDLEIKYDKIRSGRNISEIQFYIHKKVKKYDAKMKDIEHLDTVQKTKIERENENARLYVKAMDNNFTKMLLDRYLLNTDDMRKQNVMIGLYQTVYPKYQLIKSKKGLNALNLHLNYVHNHINDWNRHTNIVKYLEKAVNDYLRKYDIGFNDNP